MFARRAAASRPAEEWTRQKMLGLLITAAVAAAAMVVGLVLAVVYAEHSHSSPVSTNGHRRGETSSRAAAGTSSPARTRTADPRDALAARAMPSVAPDAAHPGPVSTTTPATPIVLPAPRVVEGPAAVPTGFPRTPAGAMAQLAAIDQAALQSGSLAGARAVVADWAVPGGPTRSSWSVVHGMVGLFDSAGLSGGGSTQLALVLTPLMGQIKGAVGRDFVIPCVDFELDVTLVQTARGATADCQRMVWNPAAVTGDSRVGRWMLGPGAEPATPPSVWPDTDAAIAVGYRDLRQEQR